MILDEALVSVGAVDALSRVCRKWRSLVYGTRWRFHGYLPISVLWTFPSLPTPERAIFRVSESLFYESNPKEQLCERIVRCVQNRGMRKLWLYIPMSTMRSEPFSPIFVEELLNAGITDLLVQYIEFRGYTSPVYERRLGGFWYQRDWSCPENPEWGCGRLAVDVGDEGPEMLEFMAQLSPTYVIVSGLAPWSDNRADPPLKGAKILGITGNVELDTLVGNFSIQEVRVLESRPLDPYEDERYGTLQWCPQDDARVCPSLLSLRGAIDEIDDVDCVLRTFPNLQELHVINANSTTSKLRYNRIQELRTKDPRIRTFIPRFNVRNFWKRISTKDSETNIFDLIASYLSIRDLLYLTRVFRIRRALRQLPHTNIPMSILSSSFNHLYRSSWFKHPSECLVTINTEEEYSLLGNIACSHIPRILVETPEPFISRVIEDVEARLLSLPIIVLNPYSYIPTTTIFFLHLPSAYVHIDRDSHLVTLHLPVSYYQWYQRFLTVHQKLQTTGHHDSHPLFRKLLPSCHFF